jgi:hypothetical protein
MTGYGIASHTLLSGRTEVHLENLKIKGFSVEHGLLTEAACDALAERVEGIYRTQEEAFGRHQLALINESDLARMPFLNDRSFFELFMNPLVLELGEKALGANFHLHLQNGIINRPHETHHQASWHRDLPYQDWVISKPLGFNAFFCLTEFTTRNGATFVLPYSHRLEYFPSRQFVSENELQLEAGKGSVIFFDSMIYHRAGHNSTREARIGVNNMFVVPILKQQIDIPAHFSEGELDAREAQVLGLSFRTPRDVHDLRMKRYRKATGRPDER